MGEATYMRSAFPTFDMADEAPAMADYLELMERYNPEGKTAMLGMQGLSAFLLFATAANACGADLTRQCVLEQAAAQDGWTAGGLHSPADPREPVATQCSLAIQVTPTASTTTRSSPSPTTASTTATPANVVELTDDYGVPAPPR